MKSSLETKQRKILRKICCTITHQNGCGIRIDDEVHVMYTKPNTVGLNNRKRRRLELAGHVVRMPYGKR
jgi:hypothetical protein